MKLNIGSPPVAISAPFLATLALKFARGPKRIRRFAERLNVRFDLPGLTEEQEQRLLEGTIGTTLDGVAAALAGGNVLTQLSKRDTTREAVLFVRDHVKEFLGEGIDIPLVPEWIEGWTADAVVQLIDERVLPWIDGAPALQ